VTIECLRAAGAKVSLDDFGTGHSSLSQICNLPLDKVKIDKAFIDRIGSDPRMFSLVETIVLMCDSLGLRCVAEGIEAPEQVDILRRLGCADGQGYLFARPMVAQDACRLISRRRLRERAA
jgi:diguanylate cyclase